MYYIKLYHAALFYICYYTYLNYSYKKDVTNTVNTLKIKMN